MEQPSAKSAYEEKKALKQKERKAERGVSQKQKHGKTITRLIIVLVIFGALGYFFYSAVERQLPQGEDYSQSYESQGREHISAGAEHGPYSSNPPSSGPHYAGPAPVGFYFDPLPDEQVIHNLEHGDVWITYHPRVSDDVVKTLRTADAYDDPKVIITPREANEFDISMVAWERTDSFNLEEGELVEAQVERIRTFILRYKNRGPERVMQSKIKNQ